MKQRQTDGGGQAELLSLWRERAEQAALACSAERELMRQREELYAGTRRVDRVGRNGEVTQEGTAPATVVRNIVAEMVEALVDSTLPMPKVAARCGEDRALAATVEDLLRSEIDRLPFEQLNDMDERTTPIQGGDYFLVEWDAQAGPPQAGGELVVSLLHPSQVLPQPGVRSIEDMDYIIIETVRSAAHIRRRYGVSPLADAELQEEHALLTVFTAYYRNSEGGIGLVCWTGDLLLQHLDDYQARQQQVCVSCGQPSEGICPACGGKRTKASAVHSFALPRHAAASDGSPLAGADESQVYVPYYTPRRYPLVLRKNVSLYGRLLGDSDVDKIRDQQNAIKKVGTRIEEKIGKGGSIVTLPRQLTIRATDEELKVVELDNPQQKAMIDVLTIQPDIGKDLAYLSYSYQASRYLLGLTDSFQGRADATATSGVAKQFSAAQTAGRLESRRVMKQAAYAELFSLMFRFLLAYAEETEIVGRDCEACPVYNTFNRYDFLKKDAAGNWRWADDFLFSVDATAVQSSNRRQLWNETTEALRGGAFGNPAELSTLLLYWTKMELLHYPGAKDTRAMLQTKLERQTGGEA